VRWRGHIRDIQLDKGVTPFSWAIQPHAEWSIIWAKTLDDALVDIGKTLNEGQYVWVRDESGRNGMLLIKHDGTLVFR